MDAGLIAGMALSGMGMLGHGNYNQIERQRQLTEIQKRANKDLMKTSYGLQKQMYDYTFNKNTPLEQRRLYEQAGMNPALAYSQGAVGSPGMGSGGASVGGGSAANEAEMQNAATNKMGMALQMGMMQSQIKVNESVAKKNEAEADKATGEAKTIESQREILKSNLERINDGMFIDQMMKSYLQSYERNKGDGGIQRTNEATGLTHTILQQSQFGQQVTNEILKMQAETGNIQAQQALTSEKAKGYFRELMIAQQNADQEGIKAAAIKLATEWSTGEYTNWKTWVEVGQDSAKVLADVIKSMFDAKAKNAKTKQ